jgi:hypothetical protein
MANIGHAVEDKYTHGVPEARNGGFVKCMCIRDSS